METVEHFLTSQTDDELDNSTKALFFGVLADLAWPIVENYRSDLYHDADFVRKLTGPTEFYYAAAPQGTSIGQTGKDASYRGPDVWHIELVRDRYKWIARVTEWEDVTA